MATTQVKYYNDQDIFDIDLDELYNNLIAPIDQIRSHCNALTATNSTQLYSADYQESRCHAFLRMTGFPVAYSDGSFYSPGYDPTLNTDQSAQATVTAVANKIIADTNFVANQLNVRENNVQKFYNSIFSGGGLNPVALSLGSTFIRSIEQQLTPGLVPLSAPDPAQTQNVIARAQYMNQFYGPDNTVAQIGVISGASGANTSGGSLSYLLQTRHYLRPFIVDPRIASSVIPRKNSICAPFLQNRSQTKIVDSSNASSTYLKRPYIERVITTRLSNTVNSSNPGNVQNSSQTYIDTISTELQNNPTITDEELIAFISNQNTYYKSEQLIFDRYFRLMRAMLNALNDYIVEARLVMNTINWQPTPTSNIGPEGGLTLNAVDPTDTVRNQTYSSRRINYELDIITAQYQSSVDQAQFDIGLTMGVDLGDFTFSNIDDTVFNAFKMATKSYDVMITKLNNLRNAIGNNGNTAIQYIEYIMGEFSGIGMLDILAIQAALWIMPINSLVGLIDTRAFARIPANLQSTSVSQNDVITSLTDFEKNLIVIYKLIQTYLDNLQTGNTVLNNTN
jgi:hypothetical protein